MTLADGLFQFLIGSLITSPVNKKEVKMLMFQFLIGSLITLSEANCISHIDMFQFLIGSLITRQKIPDSGGRAKVSIPHR